jgi:SEC-C motif domain protein
MRSRYVAFTQENKAYVLATWHATTRPLRLDFVPGQVWQQLKIVSAATREDHAQVSFIARSRVGGTSLVQQEVSRFVREGGRWFYVDGKLTE